jgi:chromosome segregation ATPase
VVLVCHPFGVMASPSRFDDGASYDSDDVDDLRDQLDAANAARAALREVASVASAEREMAVDKCALVTSERDAIRAEIGPTKVALAKATNALAKRDDEMRSLSFKCDALLRHARERDADATKYATKYAHDRPTETADDVEKEEHIYIEAMATAAAACELELIETREALRSAREESFELGEANETLQRRARGLTADCLEMKTRLEKEIVGREGDVRRMALEATRMLAETQLATRRAEAAENRAAAAEDRFETRARARTETRAEFFEGIDAPASFKLGTGTVDTALSADTGTGTVNVQASTQSVDHETDERNPYVHLVSDTHKSAPSTATAFAALKEHQRSIQTHIEQLRRDRDRFANTFGSGVEKKAERRVEGESLL